MGEVVVRYSMYMEPNLNYFKGPYPTWIQTTELDLGHMTQIPTQIQIIGPNMDPDSK